MLVFLLLYDRVVFTRFYQNAKRARSEPEDGPFISYHTGQVVGVITVFPQSTIPAIDSNLGLGTNTDLVELQSRQKQRFD